MMKICLSQFINLKKSRERKEKMAENGTNKVMYGLKNVHYAKIKGVGVDGLPTYETPKPLPGAISLNIKAEGNTKDRWADDIVFFAVTTNKGYNGDLEVAKLTDDFRTDILGEEKDTKGVMSENSFAKTVNFALLFEFDGDVKATRHVLYNCIATRPDIDGKTREEDTDIQTEKLTLKATPLTNGLVKSRTTEGGDKNTYDNWYKAVTMPVKM